MKAQQPRSSFPTLSGTLLLLAVSAVAYAQPAPDPQETTAEPPPSIQSDEATETSEAPDIGASKVREVGVPEAQAVSAPPETPQPPAAKSRLKVEFFGALLPFIERVGTSGATPSGFTGGASQVLDSAYSGTNGPARFRMTAGSTGLGFRGTFELFEQLKLTWQVESGVPIDGNGPNTWASRNSHIGFTGDWGTLLWGIWDTPWKWATLVTINPIKGSFVPDYTALLSTPGFGVGAVNTTSLLQGGVSNAAFYRRESNSVQYWSPTIAGFSARLSVTINEERPNPAEVMVVPDPYLVSGYVGFDGGGLRIRYAYEMHHDYFGMYNLGALLSDAARTSLDQGHQLTVQYALAFHPEIRTRLVATGELLSYQSTDTVPDAFDKYSRPAFYALLEQTVFGHRLWVAYGQAMPGECHRVGGNACSTTGLGASMWSVGYLHAFDDDLLLYFVGYRVINDVSARHSTFPALNADAPGSDVTGIGMGIFYSFNVGLFPG